jgi:hypothetical protein
MPSSDQPQHPSDKFDVDAAADEEAALLQKHRRRRTQHHIGNDPHTLPPSWMSAIVFATAAIVLTLMYRADLRHQQELHRQRMQDKVDRASNNINPQDVVEMNDGFLYTGTQFISFTINTFGGFAEKGECKGKEIDYTGGEGPTCYLGNSQNITEDFEHRLDLLIEVLDGLKKDIQAEDPKIDHRKHVLKIFMLPEFYLRGPDGAYTMEELMDDGILFQAAHRLSNYIATPEFSDYLFVFGTVIAASRPEINNNDYARPWDAPTLDDNQVLYYNFAPVFRGGIKGKNERFIIPKKIISKIDFLNNIGRLPNPVAGRDPKVQITQYDSIPKHFETFLESRGIKLMRDNIIYVDGIRIGIEICVDHKLGVLWDTIQKTGGDLVDVHLITAAGMVIEFGPNPVVPGGSVYMSDGVGTSAACWRHSEDERPFDPLTTCRKPNPKGIKHFPPVPDQGYSEFFSMSTCEDVLDFDLMKGYYSLYQTEGCAMTLSDFGLDVLDELRQALPSVEYYPTVDLPGGR